MLPLKCIIVFVLHAIVIVNSQRTKDKMFTSIAGASCFKRLNGTHETGCSSKFGGSVGVIHIVKSKNDFDFVTNKPPAGPYAVAVTPEYFTREHIMPLKESKHVSAIILLNNYTNLVQFSQELKCPNQYGGMANQTCDATSSNPDTTWNPFGTGLLHENFPFPIYYVANEEEIMKIHDCYEKFNNFDWPNQDKRPLCSIQINTFMSAAVNSEVCLRRSGYFINVSPTKYCDPLYGNNVYATLYPRDVVVEPEERAVQNDEKFILVSTRMDTTSMFDGVGLGAMDSLVSYTTLISTAQVLSNLLKEKKNEHLNVLFMFFNGESYDYIGSQRFVYDAKKGLFPKIGQHMNPIGLENIELMIDIGALDDIQNITLYHATEQNPKAMQVLNLMNKYSKQFAFNFTILDKFTTDNLPPTSAQSFLREDITFPAAVLYSNPTNKFYHSIYDDSENVHFNYFNTSLDFSTLQDLKSSVQQLPYDSIQMSIRNMSSALAFTLYEIITNTPYAGSEGANGIMIDELLYCYLKSAECPLFKAISPSANEAIPPIPPQRYVSVHGSTTYETVVWTFRLLGFFVGQKVNKTEDECAHSPLSWFIGYNDIGECHNTTRNISTAQSPAFLIENYDWTSGQYSTWTESTWRELNARIFLKPSTSHESLTFAIGFVVMMLSFVIVFLVNSKSDIIFGDSVSSINTFTPPANC